MVFEWDSVKSYERKINDGYVPIMTLGDDEKLLSYDGGYATLMSVSGQKTGLLYEAEGAPLLAAANVPKSVNTTVEYGDYDVFSMQLVLEFRDVKTTSSESTVTATYTPSLMYRQPDDTESWGSPDQKVLFWYWQDTR